MKVTHEVHLPGGRVLRTSLGEVAKEAVRYWCGADPEAHRAVRIYRVRGALRVQVRGPR